MIKKLVNSIRREPDGEAPEQPAKVLVADDEEAVRDLIEAVLDDDERYKLLIARDGLEALKVARREKPDLMFLDVMMPKRTGIQVCQELKRDENTSATAIIMVTALSQDADLSAAVEAGADEYICKPFSPAQLQTMVDNVLARRTAA